MKSDFHYKTKALGFLAQALLLSVYGVSGDPLEPQLELLHDLLASEQTLASRGEMDDGMESHSWAHVLMVVRDLIEVVSSPSYVGSFVSGDLSEVLSSLEDVAYEAYCGEVDSIAGGE